MTSDFYLAGIIKCQRHAVEGRLGQWFSNSLNGRSLFFLYALYLKSKIFHLKFGKNNRRLFPQCKFA